MITLLVLNAEQLFPSKITSLYPKSPTVTYDLLLSKSHPTQGLDNPLDASGVSADKDFNRRVGCLVRDARIRAFTTNLGGEIGRGKTGQRVTYMVSSISRPEKWENLWLFATVEYGSKSVGGWVRGKDVLFLEGSFANKIPKPIRADDPSTRAMSDAVEMLPNFLKTSVYRNSSSATRGAALKSENSMVAPMTPREHLGQTSTIPIMCDLESPKIKRLLSK